MSQMQLLWAAIGLSTLGAVLMWLGMFYVQVVLYLGLLVFAVGMLLGPLTLFVSEDNEENG